MVNLAFLCSQISLFTDMHWPNYPLPYARTSCTRVLPACLNHSPSTYLQSEFINLKHSNFYINIQFQVLGWLSWNWLQIIAQSKPELGSCSIYFIYLFIASSICVWNKGHKGYILCILCVLEIGPSVGHISQGTFKKSLWKGTAVSF